MQVLCLPKYHIHFDCAGLEIALAIILFNRFYKWSHSKYISMQYYSIFKWFVLCTHLRSKTATASGQKQGTKKTKVKSQLATNTSQRPGTKNPKVIKIGLWFKVNGYILHSLISNLTPSFCQS